MAGSEVDSKVLARQLYRNLRILMLLTAGFLITLAIAPAKAYFTQEWRTIQRSYNARASAVGKPAMSVGIKQIWRPEIGLTDRCISCHVGMGAATPLDGGGKLYGSHPEVHHDVSRMGCTICHRGQGRATASRPAHGHVKHWEDPMLPLSLVQSSCGQCHGAGVPPRDQVARGAYLFELHGCQSCHVVDGAGGDVGPDLSGIALKGYSRDWQRAHLRRPTELVAGSRMMSFGHLSDDETDAIVDYLDTLIGAPMLARGKALAVSAGCRACHKIDGVGGDHGPDLNDTASKRAVELDFARVSGPRTLENWHRQHLRAPQTVAPGSRMPAYALAPADEDSLIAYVLSLRDPGLPLSELPAQTLIARSTRDLERRTGELRPGPDPDGATLYAMYCAACHGDDGQGKAMPTLATAPPAVANPDMLAVASDEYLRMTIRNGRAGRDMPGWGIGQGGLTDREIDAIIAHLRSSQPTPPPFVEVAQIVASGADRALGQTIYASDCAGCHGGDGRGTEIAPSVVSHELRALLTPELLYRTIAFGRPNTAMPAHPRYDARTLAGLIELLVHGDADGKLRVVVGGEPLTERAAIDAALGEIVFVDSLASYRATGSAAYGQLVFSRVCVPCHGDDGQGGWAPAIGNPYFLRAASDGFIAGSILLGRGQRGMRSFESDGLANLTAREVGDLIVYLRDVSSVKRETLGRKQVQGSPDRGGALFASYCVGCHGDGGRGGTAPSLNHPAFLAAATDGFLQATIARGRRWTAMRGWAPGGYGFAELAPQDINDLVAHIRSWQTARN